MSQVLELADIPLTRNVDLAQVVGAIYNVLSRLLEEFVRAGSAEGFVTSCATEHGPTPPWALGPWVLGPWEPNIFPSRWRWQAL